MIGSADEPTVAWRGGPTASVSLPGAAPGIANVGGPSIPLARAPSVARGLGPVDSDLASRLINAHDPALPWWSLNLTGAEVFYGGGSSEMVNPTGTLSPLLISAAGEVVAAVWTSSDEAIRHYVIPLLPVWTPVLEWLGQRAIPELVLSTAGRTRLTAVEDAEVGDAGDSGPPTIDPNDSTAQSTPTPTELATSPKTTGAVADGPTRDDRAIGQRRRNEHVKKIRTPLLIVWNGVKKHTPATIVAIIAAVVAGLILFVLLPDRGSHAPETSKSVSPTTLPSPMASTSTTASTTTQSTSTYPPPTASPLPLAPPEEHVVQAGSSGEFFQRAVIVGVDTAFSDWSMLTITTAKLSCAATSLQIGQAVSIAGKNSDRDDYFRVTLLKSTRDVSATLRVEELPVPDWPTGTHCPQ